MSGAERDGEGRRAVGVIRSPTRERTKAEEISRRLLAMQGVRKVDVDVLLGVIQLEYDPSVVSLDEIRKATGSAL